MAWNDVTPIRKLVTFNRFLTLNRSSPSFPRPPVIPPLLETKSFSKLSVLPNSIDFLPSPSRPLWNVSTSLPRPQPSLVLLPMQEEYLLAAPADIICRILLNIHLLLDYPASDALRRAIFGTTPSIFDLWSQTLGLGLTIGPPWSFSAPPSLGRGRVAHHHHYQVSEWAVGKPQNFVLRSLQK